MGTSVKGEPSPRFPEEVQRYRHQPHPLPAKRDLLAFALLLNSNAAEMLYVNR